MLAVIHGLTHTLPLQPQGHFFIVKWCKWLIYYWWSEVWLIFDLREDGKEVGGARHLSAELSTKQKLARASRPNTAMTCICDQFIWLILIGLHCLIAPLPLEWCSTDYFRNTQNKALSEEVFHAFAFWWELFRWREHGKGVMVDFLACRLWLGCL